MSQLPPAGRGRHLAGEASNVGRMTGSSPSGWWHTSFSSSKLSLSLEFRIRKLDKSLSEFCSRHRKSGRVEEGSENFPSTHLHSHAQCPRTPLPNYRLEVWELGRFFQKVSDASCLASGPPASFLFLDATFLPWHLLFSCQVLGESPPSAQKSFPRRGFPDGRFLDPVRRGLCRVLLSDISPAPSTVPGPLHRLIHLFFKIL